MDTIICPKCGALNPASFMKCRHCGIDLQPDAGNSGENAHKEESQREGDSAPQSTPQGAVGIAARIFFGMASLFVGAIAIFPLFTIGESTNNGIVAYAAISLVFALMAFGLGKFDPEAWWVYAVLFCIPLTLLSVSSGFADSFMLAALMTAITLLGGYLGAAKGLKNP